MYNVGVVLNVKRVKEKKLQNENTKHKDFNWVTCSLETNRLQRLQFF